ncbi:TonB family protein [Trinickia sp. LjRoot230]|uniref:TonB family protein n=1 Tax=Trinickia sp. LjRoot230 TaxID=3342288 RepID=UPI003ED0F3F8
MRARVVSTIGVVALLHAALIVSFMRVNERPSPPLALESPVIRAQLLSAAPATTAPAALKSLETPPAPAPVPKLATKKKGQPHPPVAAQQPAAPAPQAAAPAANPMPAQTAAPDAASSKPNQAANSADNRQPAQAATPSEGRETLAISAPKNVRHIDCRIVKPEYPALSRRRGEAGTAEIKFVIGLTGAVESIALAKSSGYARLDDAALAAMRASACQPYIEDGAPVRAAYTQPFAFALDD